MRSLTILLIPLILLSSCAGLQPRKTSYPSVVDGDVLWIPDEYRGTEKIVVWRTVDGRLNVWTGPEYTYQDATDYGTSENRDYSVVTRWIQVSKRPLEEPKSDFGWRNPRKRMLYPELIFIERQGDKGMLEVFSNGNGGYLVVVTLVELSDDAKRYPPRIKHQASDE